MPGFLSPGKGVPLLLIPEYSGINKGQRIPDRSKKAHRKPPVKCFLTVHWMFRAALFIIAKMCVWGGTHYPWTDEWKSKMQCLHTVKYYSGIKRNDSLTPATMWVNLENIMLRMTATRDHMIWFDLGFSWWLNGKESACKMWVWSLGREDPLEEGMATHSSVLAWRSPWTEEPGRLQTTGSQRVGHNWSNLACMHMIWSYLHGMSGIGKSAKT